MPVHVKIFPNKFFIIIYTHNNREWRALPVYEKNGKHVAN
jgi:hypothetical protein